MGKRKRKDRESHIKRKIRRLEKRLRDYPSESSEESYRSEYSRYDSGTPQSSDCETAPWPEESEDRTSVHPKSAVFGPKMVSQNEPSTSMVYANQELTPAAEILPSATAPATALAPSSTAVNNDIPTTSNAADGNTAPLSDDILMALGDPKGKDEKLGPKIPDEISERWGKILVDGLTKEQKQNILEKTLIPENFTLLKAPQLNPEIAPILTEPVKNRDKILEKPQQHLGLGIAGLSNLTSQIIRSDFNKIELLKSLSEISQILLDLHHDSTLNRRKLVGQSLDNNFHNIVKDVKRDAYLFGTNLGEKIKTSKTAERSGLQVKRTDGNTGPSRRFTHRENWRGPPRKYNKQQPRRQGGPRNRYYGQSSNRRPPPADRPPTSSKSNSKNPKN